MASQEASQIRSQFEQLSKDATLDILLPRAPELDAASILNDDSFEDLLRVRSRRNLFFDENAILTLILRTSLDNDNVRALLPNIEILLAAFATDAVPLGDGNTASASGKHDLTSKTILASQTTDLISAGDYTYVVWKPTLHLIRPRAKIQRPAIYFTAQLTLRAAALSTLRHHDQELLKSFEPLPANVLEPLRFDLSLSDSNIYLPETRITKVAPSAGRALDDVKPLRGASKRAFPIVPALFTRIRYSTLPDAVIASLHLETTQLVTGTVVIMNVKFDVPNVHVESLCQFDAQKEARAGDETVLLYKLKPELEDYGQNTSTAFVTIGASVSDDRGSQTRLGIRWQAQVDLSQVGAHPSYKWSRPLSGTVQQQTRPSTQGADKPSTLELDPKVSSTESGITFNFTAAPTTVRNQEFKLDVQCINRSTRSRRFALVILQPKKTHTKVHQQQKGSQDTDLIANLFNAPPLERPKPPDVLDHNPDVRVGPLPPGACFETQMKFRAISTGVLELGVIRIVDLDTRQTVDVRELPDVIALEAAVQADQLSGSMPVDVRQ